MLPSQQLDKAKELLKLERGRIQIIQQKLHDVESNCEELEASKSELQARYGLAVEALKEEKKRTASLAKEMEAEKLQWESLLDNEKKASSAAAKSLETRISSLSVQLEDSRSTTVSLRKKVDNTAALLKTKDGEIKKLCAQVNELEAALEEAQAEQREERGTYKEQLSQMRETHASETDSLQQRIASVESTLKQKRKQISEQQARIESLLDEVNRLEREKRAGEMSRRELHNRIQELKGNIRVMCRVRPLLPTETSSSSSSSSSASSSSSCSVSDIEQIYAFPSGSDLRSLQVTEPAAAVDATGQGAGGRAVSAKKHPFTFDRVFGPEATQADVFDEISQLAQSACDGYNVCIFAYGQTGSGKTWTMEGPADDARRSELTEGMISRTVRQVFENSVQQEEFGWSYRFYAQFLEIYNEKIRDLLSSKSSAKHEIRHDSQGIPVVTDATVVEVQHVRQVSELLQQAAARRAVQQTKKNDHSSRSHSVFQLRIVGDNGQGMNVTGLLSLVDLAGSERLKDSGATGDRLLETQAINRSLACLGDVIAALANGEKHVPYRNSKLTHLLQTSLGGNSSKTLMFVNISPKPSDLTESLNSLRFAQKVNACEIGVARKSSKVSFK